MCKGHALMDCCSPQVSQVYAGATVMVYGRSVRKLDSRSCHSSCNSLSCPTVHVRLSSIKARPSSTHSMSHIRTHRAPLGASSLLSWRTGRQQSRTRASRRLVPIALAIRHASGPPYFLRWHSQHSHRSCSPPLPQRHQLRVVLPQTQDQARPFQTWS